MREYLMPIIVVAGLALAGCNQSKSPEDVSKDVANAERKASNEVAKSEGRAQNALEKSYEKVSEQEIKFNNDAAHQAYNVAIAKADGDRKVALATCESQSGDALKACNDQAEADYKTARADASRSGRAEEVTRQGRSCCRLTLGAANMENGYRNVGYYFIALPLVLIAGFWIPYFSEIPTFEPSITTPVHIHALLLFLWVALLVIQPLAIRAKSIKLHRALGKASLVLMPLILASGLLMLHKEYQEHLAVGMGTLKAREAEYLSSTQLALVATFYFLAIFRVWRRNVREHMRYIICIALVLLPAGLARTLGYWFDVSQSNSQFVCLALIDFCLIFLIIHDRRRSISSRPYAVALVAYVIVEAGWLSLGRPV